MLAGQQAQFQISVSGTEPANAPAYPAITVYYRTQDGTATGSTDYTATGDQALTFYYDTGTGGYDPQTVTVQTAPGAYADANGGDKTFSLVATHVFDPYTATPCCCGASATATITNLSLRSDNNLNGTVNATDDALNRVQPNALNLEGDGMRTEVDIKGSAPRELATSSTFPTSPAWISGQRSRVGRGWLRTETGTCSRSPFPEHTVTLSGSRRTPRRGFPRLRLRSTDARAICRSTRF